MNSNSNLLYKFSPKAKQMPRIAKEMFLEELRNSVVRHVEEALSGRGMTVEGVVTDTGVELSVRPRTKAKSKIVDGSSFLNHVDGDEFTNTSDEEAYFSTVIESAKRSTADIMKIMLDVKRIFK